jgi:hypothetical protein
MDSNPCSLDEISFFSYRHDHWLSFGFSFVLADYSLLPFRHPDEFLVGYPSQ